jgi:hypothetical protein
MFEKLKSIVNIAVDLIFECVDTYIEYRTNHKNKM